MSKHTSGPWGTYIDDVVYAGRRKIADCDSSHLADRPCPANDEDKANARLIAAAPDLLAALEALADAFADYGGPTYAEVYKRARAAIAKAKGE